MSRKVLSILIVASMLAVLLAACGGTPETIVETIIETVGSKRHRRRDGRRGSRGDSRRGSRGYGHRDRRG